MFCSYFSLKKKKRSIFDTVIYTGKCATDNHVKADVF